jgi:ribonuclease P protein subunit POP4
MYDKKIGKEELIGLQVKIKECTDPTWKGKEGVIIDETKNTFTIENNEQRKMIAKKTATFEFVIEDKKVIIQGSKIMYKPENRIKKVR